jgi:hypothetical protein
MEGFENVMIHASVAQGHVKKVSITSQSDLLNFFGGKTKCDC